MKTNKTLKLVVTSLMAAMACVATMIIKIPITATGGYINLGDCIVLLSGVVLGPLYGGLAAGIGSSLADIFSGYVVYAPATFVIKSLMAVVVGIFVKRPSAKIFPTILISEIISEIIMVAGYFLFEATIMGYGVGAAAALPGNTIQGIVGVIISMLLIPTIKKLGIDSIRGISD